MRTRCGTIAVMSSTLGFGLMLLACKAQRDVAPPATSVAPNATPPAREAPVNLATDMVVLFERVLPSADSGAPVFGPDQRVGVGARRWSRDGTYLGLHQWSVNGQMHVVAETGPVSEPLLLVRAGANDQATWTPKSALADSSFVVAVAPNAQRPTHVAVAHAEYHGEGSTLTLSPDGTRYVVAERTAIVVRSLDGTVLQSVPHRAADLLRDERICWRDANSVSWVERVQDTPELRTLLSDGTVTRLPMPALLHGDDIQFNSCDPSGGAVTLETEHAIVALDLITGHASQVTELAPATNDDAPAPAHSAVGGRGQRVAVGVGGAVTLYQRNANTWTSLWQRTWPERATKDTLFGALQVAFSADGNRLAIVGGTLVVVGPAAEAVAPSAPPSTFDVVLPKTFVDAGSRVDRADDDQNASSHASWYGQLPTVSGLAAYPRELLHAFRDEPTGADVVALALEVREFAGHVPPTNASDAELGTFARYLMPRLFEHWNGYDPSEKTTEREPAYSLKVGRTDGKPWFETRELQRDGCEPYDGYTKVVVDGHELFVVRALTYPGGPIQGWLDKFFDVPFGVKVQIARRKGPTMGPC